MKLFACWVVSFIRLFNPQPEPPAQTFGLSSMTPNGSSMHFMRAGVPAMMIDPLADMPGYLMRFMDVDRSQELVEVSGEKRHIVAYETGDLRGVHVVSVVRLRDEQLVAGVELQRSQHAVDGVGGVGNEYQVAGVGAVAGGDASRV